MKKAGIYTALMIFAGAAAADVTGAYARRTNNGAQDTYIVAVQRGGTVLVTYNIAGLPTPGLFGATTTTNVFAYGVGQLDMATMSTTITLSTFGSGNCPGVARFQFSAGAVLHTSLGTTCRAANNAPEAYSLVY